MFPGAGAQIYRNEAGEPVGWDYLSCDEGPDLDDYYDNCDNYDEDDEGDDEEWEDEGDEPDIHDPAHETSGPPA